MNRRLQRLEDRFRPVEPPHQIAIIDEADFSRVAWSELMLASTTDRERFADLIEAHTGIRPPAQLGRTVSVIIDLLPPEWEGLPAC